MLVAAHVLAVLLLLAGPVLVARLVWRRWSLGAGVFGLGLLVFVFAELGRLMAAALSQSLFAAIELAPSASAAPWIGAVLAGSVAALIEEPLRWLAIRRYLEPVTRRGGALVGLGLGAGHAGLTGALTLIMGTIAIVTKDMTFEDMTALGVENRAAVKIGLRVFAWWEGSPGEALLLGVEGLGLVLWHAGIGAFVAVGVMSGRRVRLAVAVALQAIFGTLLAASVAGAFGGAWTLPVLHLCGAVVGVALLRSVSAPE